MLDQILLLIFFSGMFIHGLLVGITKLSFVFSILRRDNANRHRLRGNSRKLQVSLN